MPSWTFRRHLTSLVVSPPYYLPIPSLVPHQQDVALPGRYPRPPRNPDLRDYDQEPQALTHERRGLGGYHRCPPSGMPSKVPSGSPGHAQEKEVVGGFNLGPMPKGRFDLSRTPLVPNPASGNKKLTET